MFSLLGLLVYVALEFLRPEVLFPDAKAQIMLYVALATIGIWGVETFFTGRTWRTFPSTRSFFGFLLVGAVSSGLNFQSTDQFLSTVGELAKLLCIFIINIQSLDTGPKTQFFLGSVVILILYLAIGGIAWTQGYSVPGFSWDNGMRLQYGEAGKLSPRFPADKVSGIRHAARSRMR